MSELNQYWIRLAEIEDGQQDLKDRFAKIESDHRAAKSWMLNHQAQLGAVAHRLANLDPLFQEQRSDLDLADALILEIRSDFEASKPPTPEL